MLPRKGIPMLDFTESTDETYADGKILLSVIDGIGLITFNNPEKRNAMSLEMWQGLVSALVELRDDPDVRVVIMAGAGDRAFVSGADVSQFEKTRHNAEASEEYSRRSAGQGAILAEYPKPTIAVSGVSASAAGCRLQCWQISELRATAVSSAFPPPNSASPMAITTSIVWSRWSVRHGQSC